MQNTVRRRPSLALVATGLTLLVVVLASGPQAHEVPPKDTTVTFFLVGDTHLLADKQNPAKLDDRSAGLASRLVDVLNRLPGTKIRAEAEDATVLPPRGVIHAGDCIDTGIGRRSKGSKPNGSPLSVSLA